MKLYNSLTRKIEDFVPFHDKKVGIYTYGPTVYSFVTIGNWRTYFLGDLVVRTLKYLGYDVDYVMNITDVGHLTGDNLGDASTGEDRLEKAAIKENKSAWNISRFYTDDFFKDYELLGLSKPKVFCKATDHIAEQIEMVQEIENKGFVYKTSDGLYFDTAKYEAAGNVYGELSNLDQVKEGARVEPNPEKKDPRDFALWKFSYSKGRDFDPNLDDIKTKRQMEWESPWGLGFPGWHIECSAMSRKYLGDQFDIHIGGEDLRSTHHPNEIAQSECATGKKPFVKYWMHGAFLQVDGGRMGKSLGNAYTLKDIMDRGFLPEHLRYFYLTGHYRQPLNFTWESLENAKRTYEKLLQEYVRLKDQNKNDNDTIGDGIKYLSEFKNRISDDFNTPKILALIWEMLKSNIKDQDKYNLLNNYNRILGFDMFYKISTLEYVSKGKQSKIIIKSKIKLDQEIIDLIDQREMARREKDWGKADEIRKVLEEKGIKIKDEKDTVEIL